MAGQIAARLCQATLLVFWFASSGGALNCSRLSGAGTTLRHLRLLETQYNKSLDARRERLSQLVWCGGGCFDSRRRVNSTVGWLINTRQHQTTLRKVSPA